MRGADAGASDVFCVGGSKLQECLTGTLQAVIRSEVAHRVCVRLIEES